MQAAQKGTLMPHCCRSTSPGKAEIIPGGALWCAKQGHHKTLHSLDVLDYKGNKQASVNEYNNLHLRKNNRDAKEELWKNLLEVLTAVQKRLRFSDMVSFTRNHHQAQQTELSSQFGCNATDQLVFAKGEQTAPPR